MIAIIDEISLNLDCFILMFLRVTALIISSPIFGRKNLPNTLKIGLCLLITYVIFSSYSEGTVVDYQNIWEFALLCIKEILFGVVLGYITTLFFSIVQTSGQMMDMQMGFGMVNVFDVQSNISIPITGNLMTIVLLITFFSVNGHLQLIYIIKATFTSIPTGTVALNPQIGLVALDVFILAFLLSVHVAIPLIASGLLGEVILGIIVRAIPQMNVFVVGIPLKILLGFLMLLLILPVFVYFSDVIFNQMFEAIDDMIMGLAPV
ncbi:MAG: flagellar biosynthetic protein FliR [Eubacteriales bacterium]|nr:flagellar biosynthetic protein FliR [Eubacteriales bacterium]